MITVVCPVYNEENYIEDVIRFFIAAGPAEKELIIIDGGSSDKTCEIVNDFASRYSNIKLLNNPDKFVPFALNRAITSSTGDPVIRLDAHSRYDDDYFKAILETFDKTKSDIVGGPMRAIGSSSFQKAVARATATSFGIGDSAFHDENHEGYVDSVYLGAWKRSVFTDVGYFDTDMIRNQDDEFHYRAKSAGKRIYLNPAIKSWYYPRSNYSALFKQYYQYGLFKPLVLKKVRSGLKLRHLIPSAFVGYLFLLCFLFWIPVVFLPLALYLLLDVVFALRKGDEFNVMVYMMTIYPVLHISYGTGFIFGMIKILTGKKPKV